MYKKIKVGLYGQNGHQIHRKLIDNPNAELVAVCGMKPEAFADNERYQSGKVKIYESLSEMLENKEIDLISLCSPMRAHQAKDAIDCLNAGKHVYSEKPAALSEKELDEILEAERKSGCEFHEMADSIFVEPYWTMSKLVKSGKIGDVVQVYVQKSYPLCAGSRPQDEETDGGLIRWVGIHAMRFLEHITGIKVKDVDVVQTHLGNITPDKGLYTASSWSMTLENGGVASACLNYLNPPKFKRWGNEAIRVFGTKGMIEIVDGAQSTAIYANGEFEGEIDISNSDCEDFFGIYIEHLQGKRPMPMSQEDELHPLRVVIRAFEKAKDTNI